MMPQSSLSYRCEQFSTLWKNTSKKAEEVHSLPQCSTNLKRNTFNAPIMPLGTFAQILSFPSTLPTKSGPSVLSTGETMSESSPHLKENLFFSLSSSLYNLTCRERLFKFVKLFRLLDSILAGFPHDLEDEKNKHSEYANADAILAFARRIRCHVRAPPEYNDPTGMDIHCVPNYFFPCPDRLAMSRTSLYHSDKPRAMPPTIHFMKNFNNPLIFWVTIETENPLAKIFYTINKSSSWSTYDPTKKPCITGPGIYTIKSYCYIEGYLLSEVSVKELVINPLETPEKSEGSAFSLTLHVAPSENEKVTRTNGSITTTMGAPHSNLPQNIKKEEKPLPLPVNKFKSLFLGDSNESSEDNSD